MTLFLKRLFRCRESEIIKELESIIMSQQDAVDALTGRIIAADEKVKVLTAKVIEDGKTITDLTDKLTAVPAAEAPVDLTGATNAVAGLEATLTPAPDTPVP